MTKYLIIRVNFIKYWIYIGLMAGCKYYNLKHLGHFFQKCQRIRSQIYTSPCLSISQLDPYIKIIICMPFGIFFTMQNSLIDINKQSFMALIFMRNCKTTSMIFNHTKFWRLYLMQIFNYLKWCNNMIFHPWIPIFAPHRNYWTNIIQWVLVDRTWFIDHYWWWTSINFFLNRNAWLIFCQG